MIKKMNIKKIIAIILIINLCIISNITIINAKIQNKNTEPVLPKIKYKDIQINEKSKFYYNKRYALIIIGSYNNNSDYRIFTYSAQETYDILTEKYGFNQSNIFVLVTLKDEWFDNLKINLTKIDYNESEDKATKSNILNIFHKLKTILTEEDLLYVQVISHGGGQSGTHFSLENQEMIYDYELRNYTKDIPSHRTIFILQPCFSGGFINDLSLFNKNVVTISSCKENQPSKTFLGPFNNGLNGSADKNNDNSISLTEIYEYTAEQVKKTTPLIKPLINDNNDLRGHHIDDFGYNSCNKYKDGYVSARIYNLKYEEDLTERQSFRQIVEAKISTKFSEKIAEIIKFLFEF